jgi:tRNA modification GTPase
MDLLLQRILQAGARIAHPGEFSKRAFLNGKLDLTQVEAVADLIEAGTAEGARLALRSLEGAFSSRIHKLVQALIQLRMYVEAAIDFPEEEIDFLADGKVAEDAASLRQALAETIASARTGRLLRDGIALVIAGPPNAGKSSLLNALAGQESAIVTDIPGTTRDLLKERIQIDGIPIHLVDTAGLRESDDQVEREGIRRARDELQKADLILWVTDEREYQSRGYPDVSELPSGIPLILVRNKIDLAQREAGLERDQRGIQILLSAKQGDGLELLRTQIKQSVGGSGAGEGEFLARRRHLSALERGEQHLLAGLNHLHQTGSGELLAEELRLAQQALNEITGEFTADDLLGEIFAGFCIGK